MFRVPAQSTCDYPAVVDVTKRYAPSRSLPTLPEPDLPKYTIGFAYILSNRAIPGMVKIGWTSQLGEDRAKKLYATGVPLPFDVEFGAATSFPEEVEAEAHAMLAPLRVSGEREFFRVRPLDAIDAVRDALLNVASIDAWRSEKPPELKRGDRIAITTQAGDLFVVLAYPHLLAKRAEPLDLWQAHSDGDLVELMGTANSGHVAGFSDGDTGGEMDPVPYLDRGHTMPNGSINGRERLVPGDRLLWFRPMAEGQSCKVVMFEILDYCQVISRTWDLKFSPDGYPLLLNYPASDEQPECVIRTTLAALRLARPRTWAPRNPDPGDGWAAAATDPPPPEYWLTQLAKRRRPARNHGSPRAERTSACVSHRAARRAALGRPPGPHARGGAPGVRRRRAPPP